MYVERLQIHGFVLLRSKVAFVCLYFPIVTAVFETCRSFDIFRSKFVSKHQRITSPSKLKMAASYTNQDSTDKFLRDLLECPVCMETIKSVPVYQCTNGHVMCKFCIEKLNKCPICRNDSALVRSLKLENIVQRLQGIQPENEGPVTSKPNLQKWGKGSVRVYGTSNGPNQQPRFEPNLQASSRQVTPRQATPRQATNNQDEEAALLQREWAENRERWLAYNSHHSMQATPRQATNNQDEEAVLLEREWEILLSQAENRERLFYNSHHSMQATPRQATNNQDEETALLQREQVENKTQSVINFFKNVGFLFCYSIFTICLVILFPVGVCLLFALTLS